jgi:hypothetical protein
MVAGLRMLVLSSAAFLALGLVPAVQAGVVVYPSAQTIQASGPLPPAGAAKIRLNAARNEVEDAVIVVTGATNVAVNVDSSALAPLTVRLLWGHFVLFGANPIPDALMPWDGIGRSVEKPNQPIWVQVTVPAGAAPRTYTGSVIVTANGKQTAIPLAVRVFDATLPPPGQAAGSLLTLFNFSAQTYLNTVDSLYRLKTSSQFLAANEQLYGFLSRYRISPASWGYGDPKSASGYTTSSRWWRDAADIMAQQMAASQGFAGMWVPISNNRWAPHNYVGGLSPRVPESWCGYLGAVRRFWQAHGWLNGTMPFVYGWDEGNIAQQRIVARQAAAVHKCFPEAKVMMTGNPSPSGDNRFLLSPSSRLDIWTVHANRFYGEFTVPKQTRAGRSRERRWYRAIEKARAAGSMIWSYNYAGMGTPAFLATEPLSDPPMLILWAALEDVQGILYGENMTAYQGGNPLGAVSRRGAYVLMYPSPWSPIASARLEEIRDGIEDWEILDLVRRKDGQRAVRGILGAAGLFSATKAGVKLACTVGCALRGPLPTAWPRWSHDATTARRIERAKLAALLAAG